MKNLSIRAQNALWVIPLFLVLPVVSASMSYKAIEQELMWSFKGEAEALAIAASEFIDREELATLLDGDEDEAEAIGGPILRLRRWGQVHRVSIHDSQYRRVHSYGGLQADRGDQAGITAQQRKALESLYGASAWVEDIERHLPELGLSAAWRSLRSLLPGAAAERSGVDQGGPEGVLLSAFAPVRTRMEGNSGEILSGCLPTAGDLFAGDTATAAETVAWVQVETNIDAFVEQVRHSQFKVAKQVFASFLLGLVLVFLLTKVVAPKLRELAVAAENVRAGRYEHRLEAGSVREINDLATTFGTMVSVLSETVDKGRRSVMDREESRAGTDVANTWVRQHLLPKTSRVGGFELAGVLGRDAPESSFVSLVAWPEGDAASTAAQEAAGFLAVVGTVDGDDPIALAARSTAVPVFIEEHVRTFTPDELLAEIQTHFGVSSARLVAWSESDDRIHYLALEADGAVARRELSRDELAATGLLVQEEAASAGPEALSMLTQWMAPFEADELLTHLERLVAQARGSGAIFIRARESAGQ